MTGTKQHRAVDSTSGRNRPTFCGGCGAELGEDDIFCRSCGKAVANVAEEAAANHGLWPGYGNTLVTPLTVANVAGVKRAGRSRPGWLFPSIVGGVVVVVSLLAVLIVVLAGGSSKKAPLAEQAAPVMASVSADLGALSGDLSSTLTAADLSRVRSDAVRLSSSSATAGSSVQGFKLESAERTAGQQLASALQATAAFGRDIATAANSPTAVTVARTQADASDARRAFSALAQSAPGLSLPATSEFSVAALAGYVSQKQAAVKAAASGTAQARDYVSRIDSLLSNSADTRGGLGQLIAGIENGLLSAPEAKSQIAATLSQRQDLQNSVSLVAAPAPFARAQQLLRLSLTAAIADDTAIQGWIDAWDTGDSYGLNMFWRQHLDATARASAAKADFVQAYDAARSKVLHTGPSPVGANY